MIFAKQYYRLVAAVLFCSATLAGAASSVSLIWDPSPDATVTGYNLYYGGASGVYTNVLSVGNITNASIGGLAEGKTYYFAVTARDDLGQESDYSNEISYIVPGLLLINSGAGSGQPINLRFPVAAGHMYELQVSDDLQAWISIWHVIGSANEWVEFNDTPGNLPRRFYRLVLH